MDMLVYRGVIIEYDIYKCIDVNGVMSQNDPKNDPVVTWHFGEWWLKFRFLFPWLYQGFLVHAVQFAFFGV